MAHAHKHFGAEKVVKGETPHASADMNVTPLIDVLLVLLIIFMVVTPLKPKRFKTLIPEQQQNTPADATPSKLTLRVDIMKDSKLQLNGEEIGSLEATRLPAWADAGSARSSASRSSAPTSSRRRSSSKRPSRSSTARSSR